MKLRSIALAIFLVVFSVQPANGEEIAADAPTSEISFTKIPRWLSETDNAIVTQTKGTAQITSVRLSIFSRVYDDTGIASWLNTQAARSAVKTYRLEAVPNSSTDWLTTIPPSDIKALGLNNPGAYPISTSALNSKGKVMASQKSFLLTQPVVNPEANKLFVAPIYSLFSSPLIQKDGTVVLGQDKLREMNDIVSTIAKRPNTPMALRIFGDTAEALAAPELADLRQAVINLGSQHVIVGGQWAPFNGTSVNASTVAEQTGATASRIRSLLGRDADLNLWSSSTGLSDPTLRALPNAGLSTIIANETNVVVKNNSDPEMPIIDVKRNLTILPSDQLVSNSLAQNSLAGTQNALAALTLRYLARPNQQNRHIVLDAPATTFMNAESLARWFDVLETTSFIGLESLPTQLGLTPLPGSISAKPTPKVDKKREAIRDQTLIEIADFDAMVAADNTLDRQFRSTFLTSESEWIAGETKTDYWQLIRRQISVEFAKVLPPPNTQQRLTTEQVTLPITIRSRTDYPVQIAVELNSSRVDFIGGSSQTLTVDRASKTARFTIKARSSGSFPIKVVLRLPGRETVLTQSIVSVDAFAATNVGVALTIISLAVLAIWWGRYIWKSRRLIYRAG